MNTIPQLAEGIMADLWRDFWIRETGTGQQVAQLHDRYMMMMMITERQERILKSAGIVPLLRALPTILDAFLVLFTLKHSTFLY